MHDREASNRKRRRLIIEQSQRQSTDVFSAGAQKGRVVLSENEQRFRTACSLSGSIEVTVDNHEGDNSSSEVVTIDRPSILIGRSASCDIRLPNRKVSFRHAYIQLIDEKVFCFDLASRAGTFGLSDRLCFGPLKLGEDILVGPYTLQVAAGEQEDVVDSAIIPEMMIKFLNSSPEPNPLALNRAVTLIGNSVRCRVRLLNDSVSSVHCSVIRTKSGIWVVDLLGRGGTLVNGQQVDVAPLIDGDELTVGRFRMQVVSAPCRSMTRVNKELMRRPQKTQQKTHQKRLPDASSHSQSSGVEGDAGPTSGSKLIPLPPVPLPPIQLPQVTSPQIGGDLTRQSSEIAVDQSGQPANTFSESFVMSLVNQFAMMQQQMFQQSQQAMTALAEILKTRHESESELVRKELEHIRELSQELRDLGRELAASRANPVQRLPDAPTQTIESPQTSEAESVTQKNVVDEAAEELAADFSDSAAETSQRNTEIDDKRTNAPRRKKNSPSDNETPHTDPHAWLAQRMADIDKERNSRWQKITRLLTGSAADELHP